MVKVDAFTVELVRADTKEAFKEHTAPDGSVYAEVEPGMDYFIRMKSDIDSVHLSIAVDGVNLGYSSWLKSAGETLKGCWERTDGVSTKTALRFNLASGVKPEGEGTAPSMLTGKVEVTFSELGEKFTKQSNDFKSADPKSMQSWTGEANVAGKKCVVSTKGSTVLGDGEAKKPTSRGKGKSGGQTSSYRKGKHLRTVILHYCTAVGLIVNKILDAPPESDEEEERPVKSEKKSSHVKPEMAKKRSRDEEAIDLTGDDVIGEI